MTPDQIRLVQDSFEKVVPIADTAAELFYGRLFEIAPDVRPLFKGDMKKQGQMLMQTLALAVRNLDRPETVIPALQSLARRHNNYGVRAEHYAPVGTALLWTLRQGLGASFTAEVEAAWVATYGLVADVMKEAQLAPA